jgi:tetratricopeptide (TPR) repeat protein
VISSGFAPRGGRIVTVSGTALPNSAFVRSLHVNPGRSRTAYFFGFGSPFGLYGGWLPTYGYPRFAYRSGAYLDVAPSFNYASDYSYGSYGPPTPGESTPPMPSADSTERAVGFSQQGEMDFKDGRYDLAMRNWRHALVDDPRNGGLVLLMAQALFQTGSYNEAAGAVQQGLTMLPAEQWGTVLGNYTKLYGNTQPFVDSLRDLEKRRKEKPDDPAVRFLLGYEYGFLGYPKEAIEELDKVLKVAPKDEVAKKLRDLMITKMPKES